MIPVRVDELEELGRLEADAEMVTGVEIDSRRVGSGDLFVAVGRGVDYVAEARAAGAAATLVPDDAFEAMAHLARLVRARSRARVVGITGSIGKTSTKDILAALLRPHVTLVAAEGGHNNEIGVPLTLCRLEEDTEVAVVEMGMRGLGQIAALAALAQPHVGVVTGIAPVHLELLGTIENVMRAKGELLGALAEGGTAVVPADVPELEEFVAAGVEVRRFERPDVEIRAGRAHVAFGGREVVFSFTARHQAANAVAALHAVEALAAPLPERPVEVEFSRWRGEECELAGGGLLINDAYNANPASVHAALAHLLERAGGRRTVAVLGEMAELGAEERRYHEEVALAAADVDVLVGVGELARHYGCDAWAPDAKTAIPIVRGLVHPGDAVLVKGSRAVGLEIVAEALAGVAAP
jgi:UDP-N-acetylmuramoyl-tripeptide--D-alanyl-D-alanine ligase